MSAIHALRLVAITVLVGTAALLPRASDATIVEFETVLGDFQVNLYDNATPQTVSNFLSYVQNLNYSNSIFHRSVPGFIVQGGGFVTDQDAMISSITSNAPVNNEPTYSNVRGTIAMAKLPGDPNSATNQWFFNLANNAGNLDDQNGGFTVFGEVTGDGMAVLDALAELPTYNFGGALTDLPLQNTYTAEDFVNGVLRDYSDLIIVTAISVIDPIVDTAAGLNPALSTASDPNPGSGGNGGGGGGSLGLFALLGLSVLRLVRKSTRDPR
jgi:peptidyl-prolyl cis-trans isomerase A (cyclophilin A)